MVIIIIVINTVQDEGRLSGVLCCGCTGVLCPFVRIGFLVGLVGAVFLCSEESPFPLDNVEERRVHVIRMKQLWKKFDYEIVISLTL